MKTEPNLPSLHSYKTGLRFYIVTLRSIDKMHDDGGWSTPVVARSTAGAVTTAELHNRGYKATELVCKYFNVLLEI